MQSPIDDIFERQRQIPCPAGVFPITAMAPGPGFFPACPGILPGASWDDLPVLVVGHNFDSEEGYKKTLARGQEDLSSPTWREMLRLLDAVGIPSQQVFFTNLFAGAIAGANNLGRFPGASDPVFVEQCLALLEQQIVLLKPLLIITLGNHVPAKLARLSPDLQAWQRCTSLTQIDQAGIPVITQASFAGKVTCTVLALTHPCLYPSNVRHRRHGELKGKEAMMAMFRQAIEASGLCNQLGRVITTA